MWSLKSCASQAILIAAALCGMFSGIQNSHALDTTGEAESAQASIAKLIEQLGSNNYATRMEAENALREMGVRALDQLKSAASHPNEQIARVAEYLLSSNDVVWFYEGDPPRVRKLLRSYGTDPPMERDNTLQRLSVLEADEGVAALARIARYESNGDLAKRAALTLMRLSDAYATQEQLTSRWQTIREVAQSGNNTASNWLLHFAAIYDRSIEEAQGRYRQDISLFTNDLELMKPIANSDYKMPPLGLMKLQLNSLKLACPDDEVLWWQAQFEAELALLRSSSRETSIEVADRFCRTGAEYFVRCNRKQDASAMASLLKSLPVSLTDLSSTLSRAVWAIDHGMPQFAIELLESEPPAAAQGQIADIQRAFRDSADWQYRLAEAYRWQGKSKEAEAAAERAINTPDNYFDRRETINMLLVRCQFDWAEKEYLRGIESITGNDFRFWIAFTYIQFLKEGNEYEKAYKVYTEYFDLLKNDETFKKEIEESRIDFNLEFMEADYLYVRGMSEVERKDFEKAKSSFREAIALQPENVDVIIEMYRLEGDEAYKGEVQKLIDESLEMLMAQAKDYEADLRQATVDDFASDKHDYANALNTYAWLLCNVDRELEFALSTSILSNRLEPEKPEYADTLARCYFVTDDIKKAIYWQELALSYSPSQRQLLITLLDYYDKASAQVAN